MDLDQIIKRAARRHGLDPEIVKAIIQQESGGKSKAVSKKGAQGLMQLMPKTAKEVGVKNPFNPAENVMGGTKYLAQMLDKFNDIEDALVAYNAGPSKVLGGIVPEQSQRYAREVMTKSGISKRQFPPAKEEFGLAQGLRLGLTK